MILLTCVAWDPQTILDRSLMEVTELFTRSFPRQNTVPKEAITRVHDLRSM